MQTFTFPQSHNKHEWIHFLNRELNPQEEYLFHSLQVEGIMNHCIRTINNNVKNKNLQISKLSVTDGNCLFDSLSSLGIGNNADELRKSITYLLLIFQDYKNFFPDQKESIKELFGLFNEIEIVFCKNDSKIYKYTFDIMCQDLYESFNWNRLPTQLILMFISKLFNVNINIINENGFEHNIVLGDENAQNLYLAHISESHYLPIDSIESPEKQIHLEYNNYKNIFIKWAKDRITEKQMAEKVREIQESLKSTLTENTPTESQSNNETQSE